MYRVQSQHYLSSRVLALIAAVVWALLPALCPAEPFATSDHHLISTAAASDAAHVSGHEHPGDRDADPCCHATSAAKVVAPASASIPKVKVVPVLLAVVAVAPVIDVVLVATDRPGRVATGPPPKLSAKYLNYSPLAPPSLA